jgi:RNA polymerase primary sigma factor
MNPPELPKYFSVLNDKEKFIITERFGLGEDGNPKTLQHVGQKLGVTRERIRQLQNIALSKLRRQLPCES